MKETKEELKAQIKERDARLKTQLDRIDELEEGGTTE